MNNLRERQTNLKLDFTSYDLAKAWDTSILVDSIRQNLGRFMPKGLYDPQDLEHQILFRLTTYDPHWINDQTIEEVVGEQYALVKNRLSKITYDLEYLLRGLSGRYADLNVYSRSEMQRDKCGGLVAQNGGFSFKVEFRKIEDPKIIRLFTEELHYIHSKRDGGEAFGLYFDGDEIPWAIETTEPSIMVKEYKRDALLAHGIDPDKAIELTRFYLLPGSPRNAISIMDAEVTNYFKPKGVEALFTTTMPAYAKTKGSTIAGGMNQVLLIKELKHYFIPIILFENMGHKTYWQGTTRTMAEEMGYLSSPSSCLTTHPSFPLLPTVEVFMPINKLSLEPLSTLESQVINVKNRN